MASNLSLPNKLNLLNNVVLLSADNLDTFRGLNLTTLEMHRRCSGRLYLENKSNWQRTIHCQTPFLLLFRMHLHCAA